MVMQLQRKPSQLERSMGGPFRYVSHQEGWPGLLTHLLFSNAQPQAHGVDVGCSWEGTDTWVWQLPLDEGSSWAGIAVSRQHSCLL